jgi:hypothetical protein
MKRITTDPDVNKRKQICTKEDKKERILKGRTKKEEIH